MKFAYLQDGSGRKRRFSMPYLVSQQRLWSSHCNVKQMDGCGAKSLTLVDGSCILACKFRTWTAEPNILKVASSLRDINWEMQTWRSRSCHPVAAQLKRRWTLTTRVTRVAPVRQALVQAPRPAAPLAPAAMCATRPSQAVHLGDSLAPWAPLEAWHHHPWEACSRHLWVLHPWEVQVLHPWAAHQWDHLVEGLHRWRRRAICRHRPWRVRPLPFRAREWVPRPTMSRPPPLGRLPMCLDKLPVCTQVPWTTVACQALPCLGCLGCLGNSSRVGRMRIQRSSWKM